MFLSCWAYIVPMTARSKDREVMKGKKAVMFNKPLMQLWLLKNWTPASVARLSQWYWKMGAEGLEKKISWIHCWNIHTPLNLNCLSKNYFTQLTIPMQSLFKDGKVSSTNTSESGKLVVFIKKHVSSYVMLLIQILNDDLPTLYLRPPMLGKHLPFLLSLTVDIIGNLLSLCKRQSHMSLWRFSTTTVEAASWFWPLTAPRHHSTAHKSSEIVPKSTLYSLSLLVKTSPSWRKMVAQCSSQV